ncbi:MAG: helix-turn-helix transcriptional regulator [Pseudomonadota bacterium]
MAKSAEPVLRSISDELSLPNLVSDEPRELSFGAYLRRQRILRGISRVEVVQVTKVSVEYLEALENNQFEKLPPRAFVVGFLRVLSRYAGLDADEIVNRYLTETTQRTKSSEDTETFEVGYFRRHRRLWLALCGAAALLSLILMPYLRHHP